MSKEFMLACKKMEGEYEEEYGMLEPDVGGEFIEEHVASKQWCSWKRDDITMTAFNAPNTFDLSIRGKKGRLLSLWDNDVKKMFDPKEHMICFYPYYGIRVPEGDYCIIGRGEFASLHIEPHSDYRMKIKEG